MVWNKKQPNAPAVWILGMGQCARFFFVAKKCKYARLCFGVGGGAMFVGGIGNHRSFVGVMSTQRNCCANMPYVSFNYMSTLYVLVSTGNFSMSSIGLGCTEPETVLVA